MYYTGRPTPPTYAWQHHSRLPAGARCQTAQRMAALPLAAAERRRPNGGSAGLGRRGLPNKADAATGDSAAQAHARADRIGYIQRTNATLPCGGSKGGPLGPWGGANGTRRYYQRVQEGTRGYYSSTLVPSGRSASSSSARRSYSAIARREPCSCGGCDRIAGRGVGGARAALARGLS
jgi:hypothetical protein